MTSWKPDPVSPFLLNPLRVGLVTDLEGLDRYPWSGHGVVLGSQTMEGQETSEVLMRFGKNKARSIRRYRQFIADGMSLGRRDELTGGGLKRSLLGLKETESFAAYDERILGSGEFVEALLRDDTKYERLRAPRPLEEILREVSEMTGVDVATIQRPGKERAAARARALFCCIAVREYGYTGKEAGAATGLGSAGVCIAVRRGEELIKNDPSIRERVGEGR